MWRSVAGTASRLVAPLRQAPAGVAATTLRVFQRYISGKYSPRGNFTSKQGNKNFYKGRGGKRYGVPGKNGGFIPRRRPNFFMPDLEGFKLKPYVAYGEGIYKEKYRPEGHVTHLSEPTSDS